MEIAAQNFVTPPLNTPLKKASGGGYLFMQ
ncbi:hypothetical protein G1C95_2319 [Bifidobacterium sp. DSM 109957]|uniref:Uncharacterized protein n=1 Tax=Bifidobacterium oedipodis TaxID=2675322 RepID=A0A7Y0HTI4_9BIFI|nr:hypothetical protein [Bifidobacterium sp. DSM 109957]